jgi:hypothetical protein
MNRLQEIDMDTKIFSRKMHPAKIQIQKCHKPILKHSRIFWNKRFSGFDGRVAKMLGNRF